jgi:hypothetical protein
MINHINKLVVLLLELGDKTSITLMHQQAQQ